MTAQATNSATVAILLVAAQLVSGAALNNTQIPDELAKLADGDTDFIDFVTNGALCSDPKFAELKSATDSEMADLMGVHDMETIMLAGAMFDKPDALTNLVVKNIPDLGSITNMQFGGVSVMDILSGEKTLMDILPEFLRKLLPKDGTEMSIPTVEELLTGLLGINLKHLDLPKLLGDKAAMLSTVENLQLDTLQAKLNQFKLPADFTIDSISDKVHDMNIGDFSTEKITDMVSGFDVSAINLADIGKSMNSYTSITEMDIGGKLSMVDGLLNGDGPMVAVLPNGRRHLVSRSHGSLNIKGAGIPLRVNRDNFRIVDNDNNCVELGVNSTLVMAACEDAQGEDQSLHLRRNGTSLQIEGSEAYFVGVDAQGGLIETANATDDFQFGILNLLPTSGESTILDAVMPVIQYFMAGDDEEATSGFSSVVPDMMADIPAAMKVLQIANLTIADVASGMKDPMTLIANVLPTLTTSKVHAMLDALPEKVVEDLGGILEYIDEIPEDYEWERLGDAVEVITGTAWTAADFGDVKRILDDIPTDIIPESMRSMLGLVDNIEDDVTLIQIVSIIKKINNRFELDLGLTIGNVRDILKLLPESIQQILPSGMVDMLKTLPRGITIGLLLDILEYALSRDWKELTVGEFDNLIGKIPNKFRTQLFKAMGMSLDIKAISKLLNKFDKHTELETLLDLAKEVQGMDFETVTIGKLSKFIASVPKDIIKAMLGDMTSMLDMLKTIPAHLKLESLLGLAKQLTAMDFHRVTIGQFVHTISSVSTSDLDDILASLGMNFQLGPVVNILRTLDQNMKLTDAFDLAKTATSLDLQTVTIGQLLQLLQSVGSTTTDNLLQGIATYAQISSIMAMFPADKMLSQVLVEAKQLVHTLEGDLTILPIHDVKSLLTKWGPQVTKLAGDALAGPLNMVEGVIGSMDETSTIGDFMHSMDSMLAAVLKGSFNNAKNMINMLPDMIWGFLKVDKSTITGVLQHLKSDKPLMEVVTTILSADLSKLDVDEIGDLLYNKLGFERGGLRELSPMIEKFLPSNSNFMIHYIEQAKPAYNNKHHTLLEWFDAVTAFSKAPFSKSWYEIGAYTKSNMPPAIASTLFNVGGISQSAFDGMINKSQPHKGFGSLTAFQSCNYYMAQAMGAPPQSSMPLANLFVMANKDMPHAELDSWFPHFEYTKAEGPCTSHDRYFTDVFALGGADVFNSAFGIKFGDKLQHASIDNLEKWCAIGSISDEPIMSEVANTTTLTAVVSANNTLVDSTTMSAVTLEANQTSLEASALPSTTATIVATEIAASEFTTTSSAIMATSATAAVSTVASSPLPTDHTHETVRMSSSSTTPSATQSVVRTTLTTTATASSSIVAQTTSTQAIATAVKATEITVASSVESTTTDTLETTEANEKTQEVEAKKAALEAQDLKTSQEAQAQIEAERKTEEKNAAEAEEAKKAEEAEQLKKEQEEREAEQKAQAEAEAQKQAEVEQAKKEEEAALEQAQEKKEAAKVEAQKKAEEKAEEEKRAAGEMKAAEAKAQKDAEEEKAQKDAEEEKEAAEAKAKADAEAEQKEAEKKAVEAEALKQFGF